LQDLINQGQKYLFNTYKHYNVVFESAKNGMLIDTKGRKYIDFGAGIAVNSLGYDDKGLKNTIKSQADKLLHCSNLYYNAPQIALAKKLVEISDFDRVFFANSGTEANEAAIKLAKIWAKDFSGNNRTKIIAFKNSFHGRTCGSLSITGQPKYKEGFGPLVEDVEFADFNDIESVKKLIDERTCAIFAEPIQGEGGVIEAKPEFLKGLRQLCDENNIMLVFDEVQTGIGRTGKLFAYQNFDVIPDAVTLAKGLGSGVPIGALLAKEKFAKAFVPSSHGTTFGGNPFVTAVALYVIERINDSDFLKKVSENGEYLKNKLTGLSKEIKGRGLMLGIAVDAKPAEIVEKALEEGLLILSAGENVIRLVPPLTIEKETIDRGFEILEKIINQQLRKGN